GIQGAQLFFSSLHLHTNKNKDISNPTICSVQLQDGLTVLSSVFIITFHALEESENAVFLDENHIQLQLNK
ncbi:hypothetical protein AMECASPLE_006866, partial [Ameca splendens]